MSFVAIGAVAERFGVNAQTVRRWEAAGLLTPVVRTPGGHRRYAADDVDRLADTLFTTSTNIAEGTA